MDVRTDETCRHCRKEVDQLFDVQLVSRGQIYMVGRGCADCAVILKEKLDEMAGQMKTAKLN